MKNSYFLLAALALTLSCTRTEKDRTLRVSFEAVCAEAPVHHHRGIHPPRSRRAGESVGPGHLHR